MSNYDSEHGQANEPRLEPWLAVTASSMVPASVALAAPPQLFVPLCVASAFLFVTGLVMLQRQKTRRPRIAEPDQERRPLAAPAMQLEDR